MNRPFKNSGLLTPSILYHGIIMTNLVDKKGGNDDFYMNEKGNDHF
jgi:hypothetical protein